jgi:hypothetical protein
MVGLAGPVHIIYCLDQSNESGEVMLGSDLDEMPDLKPGEKSSPRQHQEGHLEIGESWSRRERKREGGVSSLILDGPIKSVKLVCDR